MEIRYLKRENENGQEERFYPITHSKAIVYGEDDKTILNNMEAHLLDKNNPHGLDAIDVGAIPIIDARSSDYDMNAVIQSGNHYSFYRVNGDTLNTPYSEGVTDIIQALILSYGTYTSWAVQIAYPVGGTKYPMFYRTNSNGVISNWTTGFLPLTGGTLTGDLIVNTAIVPDVAGGANLGTTALPFTQVMSRNYSLFDSNGNRIVRAYTGKAGTTSDVGLAYLLAGNNIVSGTDGNSKGMLVLYGDGQYYAQLAAANGLTANRTISLPDKTGIAVVSTSTTGSTTIGSLLNMVSSEGVEKTVIRLYPDNDSATSNGEIVVIGAGGDTYIGSGESSTSLYGEIGNTTSENMYVSADTSIYFASNCNTIANRKTMTFNTSGALQVPTGTDYTTYKARNIAANTTVMTANSSSLTNGNIYLQYE